MSGPNSYYETLPSQSLISIWRSRFGKNHTSFANKFVSFQFIYNFVKTWLPIITRSFVTKSVEIMYIHVGTETHSRGFDS